ncbi:Fibroblast growth factor receptor 3 [Orchesella cincta]|uniref:Fibroblast growth factor receptor 3 n=1 Tax=Orchesella cincta TaxID=48709 RepID=A0A1D2MKP5_ORCCI|nr:Fibroblast growth factor receptor 3 [Orchesella cincta]
MRDLATVCVGVAALCCAFSLEITATSLTKDGKNEDAANYDSTVSESGDRVVISYDTNSLREIVPNVLQFIGGNLSTVELSCHSTKDKAASVRWKYHGIESRKVQQMLSDGNSFIINLSLGPPVVRVQCFSSERSTISNSTLIYTGENKSPYLYNHGKSIRATVHNETIASLECILRYPLTSNSSMELQLYKDGSKVKDNETKYLTYSPELGYILKLNQLKNPIGTYECRVENSASVNDRVHVLFDNGAFVRVKCKDGFSHYFYAESSKMHQFECQLPKHKFENNFKWYYQWKNGTYTQLVEQSFPPKILGPPSDEPIIYTPGRNLTCLTLTQPIDDFGWLKNGNDRESSINEQHFQPFRTTLVLRKPTLAYTNYTCFVTNFYGTAQRTYRVELIENIAEFIKVEYKENSSSFYAKQLLPQPFECKLPTHIFEDKLEWLYQWQNGTFSFVDVMNVKNTSNSSHYSQAITTSFPSVNITGIICVGTVKGSNFRYNNTYAVVVAEQAGIFNGAATTSSILVVVSFIMRRKKLPEEELTPIGYNQGQAEVIPFDEYETNRDSQTRADRDRFNSISTDDECPSDASQSIPDDKDGEESLVEDLPGFEHTMNNIEVKAIRPLKAGNFGEVYFGILHDKNLNKSIGLAIKAYKHGSEATREEKKQATNRIKKEMEILKSLEHPNVVGYIGGVTSYLPNDYSAHMFFEYCQGSDLESYLSQFSTNVDDPFYFHNESKGLLQTLNNGEQNVLRISHLMIWAEQCANGMKYLASKAILHRDLAARNVLLALKNVENKDSSRFIAKITDFDLSKVLQDVNDTYQSVPGENKPNLPFRLMSLEALKHLTFTTKSDVWSLGILFWEMFSLCMVNKEEKKKCVPYKDCGILNPKELIRFLESGGRLSIPPCAPTEM